MGFAEEVRALELLVEKVRAILFALSSMNYKTTNAVSLLPLPGRHNSTFNVQR